MSDKVIPTLITLLVVVVLFTLVWWGWRGRVRRQSGLQQLPDAPADPLAGLMMRAEGQYVVTTYADQPLERIAAHGLGVRGNAEVLVSEAGVYINRQGSPDVFIPRDHLLDVSTASGMVGKFVEREGLVVFRWSLGETPVDTGFRARYGEQSRELVDAASSLVSR